MSVEEDLAKSIREDNLSRLDRAVKAYLASMSARDERLASVMIYCIKDLYGLAAVCYTPSPEYDQYTYVKVKDILFRGVEADKSLEMRDRQNNWHVLYDTYCEPVSKERVLEILLHSA